MMNYEIFKEVVKEKFMDYMPEKFKGVELVAEPVEKVNVTLDGIILREEGRNISPTIYINDMCFRRNTLVLSRISLSSRESVIRITIFLRKSHMPRERRKRRLRKSWMMSVRMTSAFSLWE